MRSRRSISSRWTIAATASLAAGAAGVALAAEGAEWSYEGATGPSHWASLSPDYAACGKGKRQSPINLRNAARGTAPAISTKYAKATITELFNGHTIEVTTDRTQTLTVGTKRYKLAQFHFHMKSEHTVNGARSPLEIHFVHKASDGSIAVVGVLVKRGAKNAAFDNVREDLPTTKGEKIRQFGKVNPADLMPASRRAYRYSGSLTTPPCTEGLSWFVLADPITLSKGQLDTLAFVVKNNARPLQARNGRALTLR